MSQTLMQYVSKKNIIILLVASFILTLLFGMLNIDSNVVYAEGNNPITTMYHLYLDDTYLGAVTDETSVDDLIEKEIEAKEEAQESEDEDELLTYGLKETITMVPERVFHTPSSDDVVLERLKDMMTIDVVAQSLTINERLVGYFADEATVDQLIFEFKNKYVDETILNKFAEREEEEAYIEVDDVKIFDIRLSEEVDLDETIVEASELLTVDEGLRLLEKGTLEDEIHTIVSGDTLNSIASEYDLTREDLIELNSELDEDHVLSIDQEVNVTAYQRFVDVIIEQEITVEKTIKHEKVVEDTDALYKGDSRVIQEGKDGSKMVEYALELVNGREVNRDVVNETIIDEAVDHVTERGTKVMPSRGTGNFGWPAVGGYISSRYGPRWGSMHNGIDIARPTNRNILASDNGTVEEIRYEANGYGHYLVINHNNGYKTLYAHLSNISVRVGQTVPKGTVIGTMGTTGRSTGIHLHFEVFRNGSRINPESIL